MRRLLSLFALLSLAQPLAAQIVPPVYTSQGGRPVPATPVVILDPDGTAAGQLDDARPVTTTPASALNANLFSADTNGFNGVAFSYTGTFVATLSPEASNDNVNWGPAQAVEFGSLAYSTAYNQGFVGRSLYIPAIARYIRVRVSAYTSGTITTTAMLRQLNLDPAQVSGNVSIVGGQTTNGATANPNPVTIGARNSAGIIATLSASGGNGLTGLAINGDTIAGATDGGPPVKIGGVASATNPASATAGQRQNLWVGLNGSITVNTGSYAQTLAGVGVSPSAAAVNFSQVADGSARPLAGAPFLWDGTNMTAQRGDATGTWTVGGIANGTTANPAPVVIGGRDGSGILRTILTDGSGGVSVRANGDAGAGTTDAGNPLKIGGYAATGAPTAVASGQRVNGWFTVNGAQVAALGVNSTMGDGTNNSAIAPIDVSSSVGGGNAVQTKGYVFNPITGLWDRPRGTAAAGTLVSSGLSTSLNNTVPTVIKASAGKVARVSVIVAGSTAGSINDTTTTAGATSANAVFTIPAAIGAYDVDFPLAAGLVVVPGTGQVVAVSYN